MKMKIYLTRTGMFENVRDGPTRDALEETRFGKKDRINFIFKLLHYYRIIQKIIRITYYRERIQQYIQ